MRWRRRERLMKVQISTESNSWRTSFSPVPLTLFVPKCSVQNIKLAAKGRRLGVVPDVQDVLLGRHRVRNRPAKVLYSVCSGWMAINWRERNFQSLDRPLHKERHRSLHYGAWRRATTTLRYPFAEDKRMKGRRGSGVCGRARHPQST